MGGYDYELWIAEKRSAAEKIVQLLTGSSAKPQDRCGGHYNAGPNIVVTWAQGHLLELKDAHEYNASWKPWMLEDLPIIPPAFQRRTRDSNSGRLLDNIRGLVRNATSIVNAGDAGREGELITGEILAAVGIDPHGPKVRRLWLSSWAQRDFDAAVGAMKPGQAYKALYEAADARSHADWLVGVNGTRLFTKLSAANGGTDMVVAGRLKNTIVALVVDRDREIKNFKPTDHFGVCAVFVHPNGRFKADWVISSDLDALDSEGRLLDKAIALKVADEVRGKPATIRSTECKPNEVEAPLPYSLSALQIEMNRRYGMTGEQVLGIAQELYEAQLVSYPRTDCRYLPTAIRDEANDILKRMEAIPEYAPFVAKADVRLRHEAFEDRKISDHHALLPVFEDPAQAQGLTGEKKVVFDAIVRSFIGLFLPPQKYLATSAFVACGTHIFKATGRVDVDPGWTILKGQEPNEAEASAEQSGPATDGKPDGDAKNQTLPQMRVGDKVDNAEAALAAKRTRAPLPYTDGTLVAALVDAAKLVTDPKLKAALKEAKGIGTEATRSATIEAVISSGCLRREGAKKVKKIRATEKGCDTIDAIRAVVPRFVSPEFTATWETRLALVAEGKLAATAFEADVLAEIREMCESAKLKGGMRVGAGLKPLPGDGKTCPKCGKGILVTRKAKESGKLFLACNAWKRDDPNSCRFCEWPPEEKGKDGGSVSGRSRFGGFPASSRRPGPPVAPSRATPFGKPAAGAAEALEAELARRRAAKRPSGKSAPRFGGSFGSRKKPET